MSGGAGLGNHSLLAKIDRLRELNVGSIIPLPQLVVVGDQSSGKSSVLESLTGFSFPRGATLCTRYATQITCSRETERSVLISIIPRPQADEDLKTKLQQFQRRITDINNDDLARIFNEANQAMGIRTDLRDGSSRQQTFSQDILKIEVRGPQEEHFTVIDVPGIFRVGTPGSTSDSDIVLVRSMVQQYMSNSRTIILAVMPCNVDVANQEILKLASAADPSGLRTMGVLTKPDLTLEKATQQTVVDLVLGKIHPLKLGYFVVKNRNADDETSTPTERLQDEKDFFASPHWSSISSRCGVPALKARIRQLLMDISRREMPHVRTEIDNHLNQCRTDLELMGPSRIDSNAQRLFLGKLASRFQSLTQSALNGYYSGERLFKTNPKLKLITRLVKINEAFSDTFWRKGHLQHFKSTWDDEGESSFDSSEDNDVDLKLQDYEEKYPEILSVLRCEEYDCPTPLKGPLMDRIENIFDSSRGPEIGTFGGTILAIIFEEQSEKWEPLVLSHTSKVIIIVHDYIYRLLDEICLDNYVRSQLWTLIVDRICAAYHRALEHAKFLLSVERRGRPSTLNHYFNSDMQKKRSERLKDGLRPHAHSYKNGEGSYVDWAQIGRYTEEKSNRQQVCEDILDTVTSYYKVVRKRFVDQVCQQVVLHFLLDCDESPLKVLCPELVMGLGVDQLELIAGEETEAKDRRNMLEGQIKSLESALVVLRT